MEITNTSHDCTFTNMPEYFKKRQKAHYNRMKIILIFNAQKMIDYN